MAQILVIDDDSALAQSIKLLLENSNYTVQTCGNGTEGYLTAISPVQPALIIMDIMMSTDTEGFELARKLKNNPLTRKIPIIALSGIKKAMNLPETDLKDPDWFPVSEMLNKPVKPETLLSAVEKWLKSS
ncbi:MAG: response regulator [Fibrobacteres bacterium]|nr:response regulator [Fibrobacterota bacterium]